MSTLTPLVVDPDGVRRAVALARDVAAALVPGATAAPVAGPVPVAGRAPVAGPVPVAARAPVAGPVPVAARAPLAGPAPVAGPVPDATLHAVTALLAVPLPHAARLADALTSAADLHARTAAGLGAFYSGAADALAATAAGVTATDSDAAHVLAGLAGAVGAVGAGGAAGAVPPGLTVPSDLSLPPGLSVPPGLPFPPGGGAGPGGAGAVPSAEELTRRVDAALPGALASAAVPRLDDAALRVRRAIDAGAQLADLARQALAAVAGAGADIAGIVRAGVEEAAAGTLRAAAGSPTVPALAAAALTAGLTGTSARVDARLAALDDTLADLFTRTDDAVAGLPGVPPPPGRHADPAAGTPAPAPADTPASPPGEVGVVPPPPDDSGPAPGDPTGPPPPAAAPPDPAAAPDAAPAPDDAPDDAGAGAAAVAAARSVLGTPYRWGGTSPDTGFDCSGLTSWAWAQAGVTLPRTADAQTVGRPVGREELRPGDLVVWDGHVALVSGPDTMIEAGDPVQENPVRTDNTGMTFLGFWRPTG